jgi:beta-N-acetylhexosaminidase
MSATLKQIESDAGQVLIAGFSGQEAPQSVLSSLRQGRLSGVILFSRNIGAGASGLRALADLNASLDASRPEDGTPVFIAVDQEGGRVQRVKDGATRIPPMAAVGKRADRELAARVGEVIASELSALGFNLNFAPVLDVLTNPANTVIGDRAFGDNVPIVAEMAGALTVGHYMAGVVPCGKHFPGHGDTFADSHYELPVVMHEPGSLEERELLPFARAIEAGLPMIMTAHLLIPALDALHPVTLSSNGVGRLLRQEMGFGGVVVSDDLEMKAVADRYRVEEMVELGIRAGVDLFLICHTEDKWRRAWSHLVACAQQDASFAQALGQAAGRVRDLKARYLHEEVYRVPEDLSALVGTQEHAQVMAPLWDH